MKTEIIEFKNLTLSEAEREVTVRNARFPLFEEILNMNIEDESLVWCADKTPKCHHIGCYLCGKGNSTRLFHHNNYIAGNTANMLIIIKA